MERNKHTSVLLGLLLILILTICLESFLSCLFSQCIDVNIDGIMAVIMFMAIMLVAVAVMVRCTDWGFWRRERMSLHVWCN